MISGVVFCFLTNAGKHPMRTYPTKLHITGAYHVLVYSIASTCQLAWARDSYEVQEAMDVWSLGVMAFELLTEDKMKGLQLTDGKEKVRPSL